MEYRTAVFRMELRTYEPFQCRYLDYFDQTGFRVDARAFHAGCFIFILKIIVELITVAVAFLYVFGLVGLVPMCIHMHPDAWCHPCW